MGIAEDFPYMNVAMVNRRAHEAQGQQLKAAGDQSALLQYIAEREAKQEQVLIDIAQTLHRIEERLTKPAT